jgi:hypothetical protein
VRKSEGNISLRKHRLSWENNIKIDIKMGWDGVTEIYLVQDKEVIL